MSQILSAEEIKSKFFHWYNMVSVVEPVPPKGVWNFFEYYLKQGEYRSQPQPVLSDEEIERKAEEVLAGHITFKQGITNGRYNCTGIPYEDAKSAMVEMFKSALSNLCPLIGG
jgi:hypothetical protein